MSKRTPGLYRRPKAGRQEWHIDKWIRHHGRLCESTGTDDEEEAKRYMEQRIREIREALVYGVRRKRTFREAATKYLTDYAHKPSIGRSALALKDMDPFIGDKRLESVHGETFKPYIEARRTRALLAAGRRKRKALSMSTLNRNIGVARRVLRLAATVWREEDSNLTWLASAPLIQLEGDPWARKAYPLDWDEQQLLFSELAPHLQKMALFDVNTGLRDQELCSLQWSWEQRVPELDTPAIKRSVFVLPATRVKNRQARVVILNDVAQSVHLLGHRSTRVTTDYSAAELRNLLDAANRVQKSRRSPAMTVLRLTG